MELIMDIATGIVLIVVVLAFIACIAAAFCRGHESCTLPPPDPAKMCELCGSAAQIKLWDTHEVCVRCAYTVDAMIDAHATYEFKKAQAQRKAAQNVNAGPAIRRDRLFGRAMRSFPWHQGGCQK